MCVCREKIIEWRRGGKASDAAMMRQVSKVDSNEVISLNYLHDEIMVGMENVRKLLNNVLEQFHLWRIRSVVSETEYIHIAK